MANEFLSRLVGTFNAYFQIGLKAAAIRLYGFADRLELKNASGAYQALGANGIKFHNASDGTNYLKLLSGVNTTPVTLTLPIADGLYNYALVTNASGALSFGSPTFLRSFSLAYTLPDNHQVAVGRFSVVSGGNISVAGLITVNQGAVDMSGTGIINLTGSGALEFAL